MQKINEVAPICNNMVFSGSAGDICGGKCKKLISKGSFALKGGGWYKDGYTKPPKDGNKNEMD